MTFITYHQKQKISPEYISGFTDGEGCFTFSLSHKKNMPFGICVTPSFSISQNKQSVDVLHEIQKYFHCGFLRGDRGTMKYEVRQLHYLQERIRPHFEMYPLRTQKQEDFLVFFEVCDLLSEKKQKTSFGLREILEKIFTMNNSGKNCPIKKHIWLAKCEEISSIFNREEPFPQERR